MLERVTSVAPPLPSRIYHYAAEKWGKTSFASEAPNPIFVMSEGETGLLSLLESGQVKPTAHWPEDCKSWPALLDVVHAILHEKHSYKTIVIDTANGCERMLQAYVCQHEYGGVMTGKDGFTAYGKGNEACIPHWVGFLQTLDQIRQQRKMLVVLLAHAKIKSVANPEGSDYDQLRPDGVDKLWSLTHKWADVISCGTYLLSIKDEKVRQGTAPQRVIVTSNTAAVVAGNRYGLPPQIQCGQSHVSAWAVFSGAIKAAKAAGAAAAAAAEALKLSADDPLLDNPKPAGASKPADPKPANDLPADPKPPAASASSATTAGDAAKITTTANATSTSSADQNTAPTTDAYPGLARPLLALVPATIPPYGDRPWNAATDNDAVLISVVKKAPAWDRQQAIAELNWSFDRSYTLRTNPADIPVLEVVALAYYLRQLPTPDPFSIRMMKHQEEAAAGAIRVLVHDIGVELEAANLTWPQVIGGINANHNTTYEAATNPHDLPKEILEEVLADFREGFGGFADDGAGVPRIMVGMEPGDDFGSDDAGGPDPGSLAIGEAEQRELLTLAHGAGLSWEEVVRRWPETGIPDNAKAGDVSVAEYIDLKERLGLIQKKKRAKATT